MDEATWYLRTQDETFGPETRARLIEWARLGRIQPGQEVSDDNIVWQRVEDVPFLDMRFSIDIGDGNPRGPFNRAAAEALLASGRLPKTASMVEVREPFPEEAKDEAPAPVTTNASVPKDPPTATAAPEVKVVEKIVRVEVPVEKVVEKIVEKEVRVEVPVEKVVEVEKVVIDETRVKELEGLLEEERRHTADLQTRMDETSRKASEASLAATERTAKLKAGMQGMLSEKTAEAARLESALHEKEAEVERLNTAAREAAEREQACSERIAALEDELKRLPQKASEVADIQAALYAIMHNETEELGRLIEQEKQEFEEFRRRHVERSDRLLERRREMLKRCGDGIEEMTHKALIERPEDPRTTQLRHELEELRRVHERAMLDSEAKLRDLGEQLRIRKADDLRAAEVQRDTTQLRQEAEQLRAQLQIREKELLTARQENEELRQRQETSQQVLMARLASLESPSIGTPASLSTNQSREAHLVKLPGWMKLKK